ncbi:MAG: gamma carbonic anhydrase family protein [Eggerthellaceae bacterium]|nr:gamma carbonic anhydrase family protein [Eggerthellaceae bacterium]
MGTSIRDYHQVKTDESACLSPYATICGDVTIGAESSVFAGTQIRGDCEPVTIGARTNIQENSCLHVSMGSKLTVGNRVTVGHMAMLHGCTIEDNVLIGMGSTVMDDAHIGRDSIVAAGSLVTQRKEFPPRSLIMGSPARLVRELADEEIEAMVTGAADAYYEVAKAMVDDGLMSHPSPDTNVWPEK